MTLFRENQITALTGRFYNITKDGLDFQLQGQQANKDGHNVLETISFIAGAPSSGTIDGISYVVDTTFSEVTDELHPITFYRSFKNNPVFIADMQTKNAESAKVLIHEERSKNAEMKHAAETVGYIVFDSN